MARPLIEGKKHNGRMSFAFTMNLKKALRMLAFIDKTTVNRLAENVLQKYVDERSAEIECLNHSMQTISRH